MILKMFYLKPQGDMANSTTSVIKDCNQFGEAQGRWE